jgi:predicted metal-dependent phosphoesterase TrpH
LHSRLSYQWKEPLAAKEYRAAVSLHGHTNRSKEGLYFIVEYASRRPLLRLALATQERKAQAKSSITVNFFQSYWTPPLSPWAAIRLECDQIERGLGIASMVSLTDHDSIEAPLSLRVIAETAGIPISVEWSVPYQNTTLHLGIHNLPGDRAESITAQLTGYTESPLEESLPDLLAMLHKNPDLLIVLNHPLWDLARIGRQRHIQILTDFVARFGNLIHAFELGGLRSWEENRAVLDFAGKWNQLVIGGGDRHGAEPSAVLNLTDAESFPEFVHEVRKKQRSHVLFMPQYAEPFSLRILQSLLDVIREYPDHPRGSRRWDERVFHPDHEGVVRPLAALWQKPPAFIEMFFSAIRTLELTPVRKAVQFALARPEHEMYFALGKGQEAASQWKKTYGSPFSRIPTTRSTAWRTPAGNLRRSQRSADSSS